MDFLIANKKQPLLKEESATSRITISETLSGSATPGGGLVQEFFHSALHSAVQSPLSGLTQLVDQTIGTNLLPKVQFMGAPEERPFFTTDWHAQQLGTMVGMAAPFLLLNRGVGKCRTSIFGRLDGMTASNVLARHVVGESIVTGALFEGIFRPVDLEKGGRFCDARLANAFAGGVAFGTLSVSTLGIQTMLKAEVGLVPKILRSEIGSTMLAGVPAGLVSAEVASRLNEKRNATWEERGKAIYSFAVLGGAMAASKKLLGSTQVDSVNSMQMRKASLEARESGAPGLAERLSAGISEGTRILRSGSDNILGPGPQLLLEGAGNLVHRPAAGAADGHILHMALRPGGINDSAAAPMEAARKAEVVRPQVISEGKKLSPFDYSAAVRIMSKHFNAIGEPIVPDLNTRLRAMNGRFFKLGDGRVEVVSEPGVAGDVTVSRWHDGKTTVLHKRYADGLNEFQLFTSRDRHDLLHVILRRHTDGSWYTSSNRGTPFRTVLTPESLSQNCLKFFNLEPDGPILTSPVRVPLVSSNELLNTLMNLTPVEISWARMTACTRWGSTEPPASLPAEAPVAVVVRPLGARAEPGVLRAMMLDDWPISGPRPISGEIVPGQGLRLTWPAGTDVNQLRPILMGAGSDIRRMADFGVANWELAPKRASDYPAHSN